MFNLKIFEVTQSNFDMLNQIFTFNFIICNSLCFCNICLLYTSDAADDVAGV